ncbi:MAG TPA: bifunctional phosphopantothenoylcysteine decarboxylase/phosphopantothenate--cysteine ligase CoaBC [Salinivirgaceae bacterium]|nr:bifunctional phosphopantothenoylcysteine decarboxylase/phosphopantothenate--cysteine ligase CoaBC [Salinivirgaceae bacterium]
MMLKDKHIILGITGSIAAFKAATLCRLLVKQGATVKVVMTPLAKEFITPVTMATLSQNTVLLDFFKHDDGAWNSHVELGLWADLMLIAPASANTMAKMANGICDNLLLTTYLSVRCPVMIAPAMDMDMYRHPATQKNIDTLKSYGNIFVEPEEGELASGLVGKGRMAEPEHILQHVIDFFNQKKKFKHQTILVTSGPTFEPIDAVRFIGNHSTGKMGNALATALESMGAHVVFITGPVSTLPTLKHGTIIQVQTAEQMFHAATEHFPHCSGAILAAAVADFRPETKADFKLKSGNTIELKLVPNPDIAASLGKIKKSNQFIVGFALETDNELENAIQKINKKNLDLIVLNSLKNPGAGFGYSTNQITIINRNREIKHYPLKSKTEVAYDILEEILSNKLIQENEG